MNEYFVGFIVIFKNKWKYSKKNLKGYHVLVASAIQGCKWYSQVLVVSQRKSIKWELMKIEKTSMVMV